MKRILSIVFILFVFSCSSTLKQSDKDTHVIYHLSLKNPAEDVFRTTVLVSGLKAENNIYNFVSTAPGTYDNLNYGRLVKEFKAYDASGNEVSTEKISTNQWKLSAPERVAKVVYVMDDSFESVEIMPMGGTDIAKNHALINTFGVFGYFKGMQSTPIKLKMEYPENWMVGTALEEKDGYFHAKNYDHFADSPILLGELTKASTTVGGMPVDIYVYSTTGAFHADSILNASRYVLESANKFIGFNAAPRYVFLMSYLGKEDREGATFQGFGALEHQMSSAYVLPERGIPMPRIAEIMAHEFYHIVTPLNIHSEVIATYNFAEPTPSEHLWLYEGVTEWASHMMLLRNNERTAEEYLAELSNKINTDIRNYDQNYSIAEMSLNCYDEKGQKEYGNVYQRGAVIAGLLDIRLLELSNGERGLREVLYELSQKYGTEKAFSEKTFFDDLVALTYPEIRDFINNYIRGTKPFPYEEYYSKIGVTYISERPDEKRPTTLGFGIRGSKEGLMATGVSKRYTDIVFKEGDILKTLNGTEVTFQNVRSLYQELAKNPVGTEFTMTILRDKKPLTLTSKLYKRYQEHSFELNTNVTGKVATLQKAWLTNKAL